MQGARLSQKTAQVVQRAVRLRCDPHVSQLLSGPVPRLDEGPAYDRQVLQGPLQGHDGAAPDPHPALPQLGLGLLAWFASPTPTPQVGHGL